MVKNRSVLSLAIAATLGVLVAPSAADAKVSTALVNKAVKLTLEERDGYVNEYTARCVPVAPKRWDCRVIQRDILGNYTDGTCKARVAGAKEYIYVTRFKKRR